MIRTQWACHLEKLTIGQACLAILYCAITFVLYVDNILPTLINLAIDLALLIALAGITVSVGKPLSHLDCSKITTDEGSDSISAFVSSTGINALNQITSGGKINYFIWAGASKTTCYEMKAIWAICIALCTLFAFSAICSIALWRRNKAPPRKGMV